jgi:hypothetical protein
MNKEAEKTTAAKAGKLVEAHIGRERLYLATNLTADSIVTFEVCTVTHIHIHRNTDTYPILTELM